MVTALTHVVTPLTYLLALLVVGGLLFLLASFTFGRGEQLAPMPADTSPVVLPANRPVTSRDVHRLRLSVVLRGYRMSEVDWVLDQLATQLDERDRELAELRAAAAGRSGSPGSPGDGGADRSTAGTDRPATPDRPDQPDSAARADDAGADDAGADDAGRSAPADGGGRG